MNTHPHAAALELAQEGLDRDETLRRPDAGPERHLSRVQELHGDGRRRARVDVGSRAPAGARSRMTIGDDSDGADND